MVDKQRLHSVIEGLKDARLDYEVIEDLMARVAELEARLSVHECVDHPEPQLGVCDDCDSHNPEPMEKLGPW